MVNQELVRIKSQIIRTMYRSLTTFIHDFPLDCVAKIQVIPLQVDDQRKIMGDMLLNSRHLVAEPARILDSVRLFSSNGSFRHESVEETAH